MHSLVLRAPYILTFIKGRIVVVPARTAAAKRLVYAALAMAYARYGNGKLE